MNHEPSLPNNLDGRIIMAVLAVLLLGLALACGGSAAEPTRPRDSLTGPGDTPPAEGPPAESPLGESPPVEKPPTDESSPSEPEPIAYLPDNKPCPRSDYSWTPLSGRGQAPQDEASPTSAVLFKLPGGDRGFAYAAFSPDGQMMVTVDGIRLRLWPAGGGAPLLEYSAESDHFLRQPAFTPDGQRLAVPASDGLIHLLDVTDGRELAAIEAQSGRVAFDPTGQLLAVADGRIARLIALDSGQEVARYEGAVIEEIDGFPPENIYAGGHARSIASIVFSPDGQALLTAGYDGTIRLWETDSGRPLRCYEDEQGSATSFRSAALSPDGSLIVGQRDDALFLWDAFSGQILRRFDAARSAFRTPHFKSASFSPDGQRILSASEDRTVRVWNVSDGRVEQLMRHPGAVNWAALDPAGQRVIAAFGAGGYSLGGEPIREAWIWDANHVDVLLAAEAQNLVEEAITLIVAGDPAGGQQLLEQAQAINPFDDYDLVAEGQARAALASP